MLFEEDTAIMKEIFAKEDFGMLKYGYNKEQYKKFNAHAWRYLILFSLLYCAHYCTRLNLGNAQVKQRRCRCEALCFAQREVKCSVYRAVGTLHAPKVRFTSEGCFTFRLRNT